MVHKRPVPTAKLIYGTGLILIGGFTAITGNIIGIIGIALGIYFLKSDGIEIDLQNKKYRNIISLFGISYGQWKAFPEIEYVSVFKTTQTTRVWVSTASTNVTNTVVKVNLFYNTNKKIEVYVCDNTDDAFIIAKQIANALNIDVLDATSRETKWL